ncbi:MAG: hypothetical protein JWQ38_3135 [Flavipsychrobacter sp.]|nr:hypothetical protein [Flavipsychrobacter sp.]
MYFNGTKSCALILSCFLSLSLAAKDIKTINTQGLNKPLCFVENKGQVKDQDNNPRADIHYKLSAPGMSLYVGNGQLHYQFIKGEGTLGTNDAKATTYRMDVTLLGANPNAKVISAEQQEYYENYFQSMTSNEALTVHSFDKIIYKDVYPNIDWMIYVKNHKVEYDFVVRAGGNIHDIQLKYDGTTALNITKDGGIAAETPLGTVKEKSPYAYETETGKLVASNFVLHNNIVSFEAGAHTGALTIDPLLEWSTYLGGANEDVATSVKSTTTGNIFVGGFTSTIGIGVGPALHTTMLGGTYDGFLAKYSNTGALMFMTYFGGVQTDKVNAITLDNTGAGNPFVYIAGVTNSPTIAPIGFTTTAYHLLSDGFVAKLNNSGTALSWATYYGGTNNDQINAITCDASNNIYITGQTNSLASIATAGTFQTGISGINDAFVAKLSGASGTVTWGTYYGGSAQENAFGIALDNANNVIITGQTNSVINISTTGAYHTTLMGTNDAFVGMLNPSGTARIWGTYLGGSNQDQGNAVACNPATGKIAVIGNTTSPDNIATAKAYQSVYAGGPQDAFISYFNNDGSLVWGTYFGGAQPEYGQTVCIDNNNNVVIAGATFSTTGISSASASQPAKYGDYDAYLAKFNILGQRIWSSYFGGLYYDYANSVTVDNNNQIVLAGFTTSSPSSGIYGSDGVATTGAPQTTFSGGVYDAFITKFNLDTFVALNIPYSDTLVCAGGVLNVNYTASSNFNLANTFTVQLSNGAGSFASPANIGFLISNASTGTISCTVPLTTPLGTGYRIRIVASNPAFTSPDSYFDIRVVSSIGGTTVTGSTPVCVDGVISLADNASYTVSSYSWTGPALSGFSGTGFTSNLKNPFNNGLSGLGITKNDSGRYYVTTVHNGCPAHVDSVSIEVNDLIPPTPILSAATLNCAGSPLNLFANPDTTAPLTYNWSGPAGFTSTLQNPVRTGAKLSYTGTYSLTDYLNGCPSLTSTIVVTITDTIHDEVRIAISPDDTVCKGTLVKFTATPLNGGVSPLYQWTIYRGTTIVPIVGAVSDLYSTTSLIDADSVYVTMASSVICPSPITAISNGFRMNVISNPPIVKIFADKIHVAPGDSIEFTSAIYNGGIAPLYQWKKNGVNIPGANSDSYVLHNVTGPVTISLELTSTMLCSVPNYSTSEPIIANTNVGVANLATTIDNVELFPNPNNGSFSVKGDYYSTTAKNLSIDVLNPLGQVVYTTNTVPQNNTINKTISLNNIPDGVYMLRISDNEHTKTLRFTINR